MTATEYKQGMLALFIASAANGGLVEAWPSSPSTAAFATHSYSRSISSRRHPWPSPSVLHSNFGGGEGSSNNGNDDASNLPESSNNFYNDFDDLLSSPSSSSSSTSNSEAQQRTGRTLNTAEQQNQFQSQSPSSSSISSSNDPSFFSSLQKRTQQLQQSSRDLLDQWTKGSAKTFAAFTINEQFYKEMELKSMNDNPSMTRRQSRSDEEELPFDWVRRISIGTYPRVACGTAYGSIVVADVESKRVLGASARNVHTSNHNSGIDGLDESLKKYLYGQYDGGGVLAVAMYGNNLVASAGREGGVKLFRLSSDGSGELEHLGDVPSLRRPLPGTTPVLITSLKFDSSGRLFMGGQDGVLRMVTLASNGNQEDMKVTVISSRRNTLQQLLPLSPILSLDVSEELDMVATAHANGNVCVYSMDGDDHWVDGAIWNPFSASSSHARSVAFVARGTSDDNESNGTDSPSTWAIVAGGGNGELWMQEIRPSHILPSPQSAFDNGNGNDDDDTQSPAPLFQPNSIQQIKPSHQGPVLSLAARPTGGILVSAGHDGMLRVTQLWSKGGPNDSDGPTTATATPRALYGLGGYKVWIGNVCIDAEGKRLLSDGRDDVVVVHDFSKEDESEEL